MGMVDRMLLMSMAGGVIGGLLGAGMMAIALYISAHR